MDSSPRYRPNVAAIIRDREGRILVCERTDVPGAWQFPQGGLQEGEQSEAGMKREVAEELSLQPEDYRVVKCLGPYRYRFEKGRKKGGYDGQEQRYYLLDLLAPSSRVNVETEHREFRAARWIRPEEFKLDWLMETKRKVYCQVLKDFFGVTL